MVNIKNANYKATKTKKQNRGRVMLTCLEKERHSTNKTEKIKFGLNNLRTCSFPFDSIL